MFGVCKYIFEVTKLRLISPIRPNWGFYIGAPYGVCFRSHSPFVCMNFLCKFEMLMYWMSQTHHGRVGDIGNRYGLPMKGLTWSKYLILKKKLRNCFCINFKNWFLFYLNRVTNVIFHKTNNVVIYSRKEKENSLKTLILRSSHH